MTRSSRLIGLIQTLSGRREHSVDELAERFGVSRRTVYRDLGKLESELELPLVRGQHGFRLFEGATLPGVPLSSTERGILRLALGNPALRADPALADALGGLHLKLGATLPTPPNHGDRATTPDRPSAAGTTQTGSASSAEANTLAVPGPRAAARLTTPERTGTLHRDLFRQLERAISERLGVRCTYHSLSGGDARRRTLEPLALFHRDGAWYLVAHSRHHDQKRIYRLDRIADLEVAETDTFAADDFDLGHYLADSWSVYRGDQVHDVELAVDPDLAPLFRRAALHPNGRLTPPDPATLEAPLRYHVRLNHLGRNRPLRLRLRRRRARPRPQRTPAARARTRRRHLPPARRPESGPRARGGSAVTGTDTRVGEGGGLAADETPTAAPTVSPISSPKACPGLDPGPTRLLAPEALPACKHAVRQQSTRR